MTGHQLLTGEVVATFGRHYRVRVDHQDYLCFTRGKRSDVACGDQVQICIQSKDQGVIEKRLERRNLIYRSDQFREKLIAANVDQILLVLAAEPSFSPDLVSRALVAAEAAEVPLLIVLNKSELPGFEAARARTALYVELGYEVLECSLKTQPQAALQCLLPRLLAKTTAVIGQSGMGKSTLINLLITDAKAQTREISEKLDSGKHTTTYAQLYCGEWQSQAFRLMDSPGFQEFGLAHLSVRELENAFVDFRNHLGGCRFYNCQHLNEPGCEILRAAERGMVDVARLQLYWKLVRELKPLRDYRPK
jgi:ribosome biogenesis GTPase